MTTVTSKQMDSNNDTTTAIFTLGGEGRTEMNLPGMMGVKGAKDMALIAHANQPQYSISLDADHETY